MAGMNFKQFEVGQDVRIFKGKNKGIEGTCAGFNEETGAVEIEKADGNTVVAANGVVDWIKNEFYDASEFDVDMSDVDEEPVEPAFSEYARDPELIEAEAEPEVKPITPKKESKPCQCGCGLFASKGKMFRPGHDQRHKGNLIRAMQEGSVEAEQELIKRRWRTENEILDLKSNRKNPITSVSEEDAAAAREMLELIS